MTREIRYEQVRDYIDENHPLVTSVEEKSDEQTHFHFVVWQKNLNVNVLKHREESAIHLLSRLVFQDEQRAVIGGAAQNEFFSLVSAVLTNAPGYYLFQDADGNVARSRSITAIQVEQLLYPDALTQQKLMEDTVGIFNSLTYIRDTARRLQSQYGSMS